MAQKYAEIAALGVKEPMLDLRIILGVGGIGLEPTTFAMSTQRSNQLS